MFSCYLLLVLVIIGLATREGGQPDSGLVPPPPVVPLPRGRQTNKWVLHPVNASSYLAE